MKNVWREVREVREGGVEKSRGAVGKKVSEGVGSMMIGSEGSGGGEEGRGERRGEGQSNIIGPCYKRRRPTVAATPHVSRSAQAAPEQSTRMVKLLDSYYRAYRICFPVVTGVFLILPEMRKREKLILRILQSDVPTIPLPSIFT